MERGDFRSKYRKTDFTLFTNITIHSENKKSLNFSVEASIILSVGFRLHIKNICPHQKTHPPA